MKKFKFQDSTFAYLGSKKRQSSTLATFINPEKHNTLVSAFSGGCSFEVYAKHKLGMKIVSSDWSYISFIAQKALLGNNNVKITQADIIYLFKPNKNDGFVKKNYAKFFTDSVCDFLDTATENIRQLPEDSTKKYLLSHLIISFITHILAYGKFGCVRDIKNIREKGMIEALEIASTSESRVRKLVLSTQHPLPVLKKLSERINAGIIDNNRDNPVYCEDALSFLPKISHFGDEAVLFLDPPYFQSSSYQIYEPISEILLGKKIETQPSVFNGKDVEEWFDKLFSLSQPFSLWLITYGGKIDDPNAIHSDKFLEMVRKHRPNAKLLKLENFTWSINSLSGQSPKQCEEYIIIAEQ